MALVMVMCSLMGGQWFTSRCGGGDTLLCGLQVGVAYLLPQVVVTDSDKIQNFDHWYKDFTAVFP